MPRISRLLILASVLCAFVPTLTAQQPAQQRNTHLTTSQSQRPLRLAVIGLVHGHVEGLLWQAADRPEIEIVGIYEPDRALFDRMAEKYNLHPKLYFDDLDWMIESRKPEAASVMTSTFDHLMAVEACAPMGVHVMVEKPLAVSNEHAQRIASLAERHEIRVLTNYETSWYASVHEAHRLTRENGWYTPIRRAVFRHGHKGPIEIGCSPEFLSWLTDAEANGAGALFDFGCYGANQMTWLMNGAAPTSVTATVSTNKPGIYQVDDDSTIVLTYPGATAIVQGSWSWTHDNKDTDLYTEKGSIHCQKWDAMTIRKPDNEAEAVTPPPRPQPFNDEWAYLHAVVRGDAAIDPLSSLENNLVVVRILDAARRSAATGEAVTP